MAPGLWRIALEPLRGWKPIFQRHQTLVIVLVTLLAFSVGMPLTARPIIWQPIVINGLLYGTGLVGVIGTSWYYARRRVILEVTSEHLTLIVIPPAGSGGRSHRWPRGKVGRVGLNASNGKVAIHIVGQDMIDLFVSPNREVANWVAEMVNAAVHGGVHGNVPREMTVPAPPPASKWGLRIAAGLSIALGLSGVILFLMSYPGALCLMLSAAIPVGIAYGTQEKDFYF
jgi:hypothetical protein